MLRCVNLAPNLACCMLKVFHLYRLVAREYPMPYTILLRNAKATLSLIIWMMTMFTFGCTSHDLETPEGHDKGYYSYHLTWPSLNIPVCWEDISEVSEIDRRIVKIATEKTWAAHVPFNFSGWDQCQSTSNGIRIRNLKNIENSDKRNPHTRGLGTRIRGVQNGMVLKFNFSPSSTCGKSEKNRRMCVYIITVHEFGHALGIAHEQNRPDAPSSCDDKHMQGSKGDVWVGEWDIHSVMNYCNPKWSGFGNLSEGDINTIKFAYSHLTSNLKASTLDDLSLLDNHDEFDGVNQSCADALGQPVRCDIASAYQSEGQSERNASQCFDDWGYEIDCNSNLSTSQSEIQCFDDWGYEIDCNSNSNNSQGEEQCFDDWGYEIDCY